MTVAALLILAIVILCLPVIVREIRRIAVSIASEVKALKDEVANIAHPAPVDLTAITNSIADLNAKVDALTALVGTPEEVARAVPEFSARA